MPQYCSCKSETFSTLRFAQRAKAIKNKAVVNEVMEENMHHLREVIRQLKVYSHSSIYIIGLRLLGVHFPVFSKIPITCTKHLSYLKIGNEEKWVNKKNKKR